MRNLLERIAAYVNDSDGPDACHPWVGPLSKGRPTIWGPTRGLSSRRVIYEAMHGALPSWQRVYSSCGNYICCNHRHLIAETLEDRLWRNVDTSGGPDACWPWTNKNTLRGYGRIGWMKKRYFAHRLAFLFSSGEDLRDVELVMHTCDNPPCCNPRHLRRGTALENMRDCISKGRHSHGEKHSRLMREAKAKRSSERQSEGGEAK